MKRFYLQRYEDETGVSGTGKVAEGVMFQDGRVVMQWLSNGVHSIVFYDSLADVEKIHGHEGRTKIVVLDVVGHFHNINLQDDSTSTSL